MEKTRFKGAVFATASALLYGLGAALIKLATKESMSVATLLVGRGGCGMLLLLLAGCIRRKPPAVKLRSLPKIALYGVFGTVATQIFLNLAYLYLPVGTVTTIHFMYPALVAVMEAVLFRQKLPGTTIITLAVLTISMGLLLENVTAGAERGLLFAVLSVLTWTFQLLYMERSGILEEEDRQTLTFYICLLMAVVGLIYGALAGDVDEGLFAVEADHAEGLDVGRVDADIRDDGEIGDQRIRSHVVSSPSVLTTLTMFMWIGHFARHRPQPTQPKIPSLLSGK